MATTREQAEAYNYEGRRQATTLMTGEDEAQRDPRRRINRVTAAGVLVGVLVMAGFGIAGFLGAGRGPGLPESGGVLVSGTGDRYVVLEKRLHPALNLASALLVGGGPLTQVRAGVLDSLPRGLPIGIPDAPDALPQPDRLSNAPWTVCAVPSGASTIPPEVTLGVGLPEPTAGRIEPGSAVVALDGDTTLWLLHDGRRYRLVDNAAVLLGLQAAVPVALPNPLLDLLPEGAPIVPPDHPDRGQPVEGVPPEWVLGDVVRAEAGGTARQSFAVLGDGLSPVSDLTAALLVASGGREARATPAVVSAARQSLTRQLGRRDWPAQVSRAVGPQRDQPLCFSTTPGDPAGDAPWTVRMTTPGVVIGADQEPVHTTRGDVPGVVEHVVIPRGAGALVRAATASGGDAALTLVTDSGLRYAVPTPDAAVRLRYDPAAARALPAPFVRLLPAGPALDPEVATREFTGR